MGNATISLWTGVGILVLVEKRMIFAYFQKKFRKGDFGIFVRRQKMVFFEKGRCFAFKNDSMRLLFFHEEKK